MHVTIDMSVLALQMNEVLTHICRTAPACLLLSSAFFLRLQRMARAISDSTSASTGSSCLQQYSTKTYGSGAFGFSIRLTSANFRVFFALPMTQLLKQKQYATPSFQGAL